MRDWSLTMRRAPMRTRVTVIVAGSSLTLAGFSVLVSATSATSQLAAMLATSMSFISLILTLQPQQHARRRLRRIANAANAIAGGNLSQPRLDEGGRGQISRLARSFNFMVDEMNRLSIEYDRLVNIERSQLEAVVSERTGALEQSREMFRLMAESTKAIPFTLDLTGNCFSYIGAQAIVDSGIAEREWALPGALDRVIPRETNAAIRDCLDVCEVGPIEFVRTLTRRDGRRAEMRWTGTCEMVAGTRVLRGLMLDITELRRLGRELAAAHKLEAVGRLAAGVAHEINTPVQFVSDNIQFVRRSMTDLASIVTAYRGLGTAPDRVSSVDGASDEPAVTPQILAAMEEAADLDFVLANLPLALDGAVEGLDRIATIVRSMKEFAHPDQKAKTFSDINQAIRSTLVIASGEYKYVAEIETHFGDLPAVQCHVGEINQVILNLLTNGSHAIADIVKQTGQRGKLTVSTRSDGKFVEISIADTGTGIHESIRDRIFDPFFTSKEVGKGTGQGLAHAHSVIVLGHGGSIRCVSDYGKGSTFIIGLPIETSVHAKVSDQ